MSLQTILNPNVDTIYAKKAIIDELEITTLETDAIILATPGGSASPLNYYEQKNSWRSSSVVALRSNNMNI